MENKIKAKTILEVYSEHLNGLDNMEIVNLSKERIDIVRKCASTYIESAQLKRVNAKEDLFCYAVGKLRTIKDNNMTFVVKSVNTLYEYNSFTNISEVLENDAEKILFVALVVDYNLELLNLYNTIQNCEAETKNIGATYRIFKEVCKSRDNGFYNPRLVDTELKLEKRLIELEDTNILKK